MKLPLKLMATSGDGSVVVAPEVFSVKDIRVTAPELLHRMNEWKSSTPGDFKLLWEESGTSDWS